MDQLLALVGHSSNTVENSNVGGDYENRNAPSLGGGSGQNIPPAPPRWGGGGSGGGMETWQTSVENRLSSLDTRLGGIEGRLGGVETKLATLDERVAHLPGKGFIVSVVIGGATVLGAVGHYAPKLIAALGG